MVMSLRWLMGAGDPHLRRALPGRLEHDAPLVVDSNAARALQRSLQCLEPVPRWTSQIGESERVVQHVELSPGDVSYGSPARSAGQLPGQEKALGGSVGE